MRLFREDSADNGVWKTFRALCQNGCFFFKKRIALFLHLLYHIGHSGGLVSYVQKFQLPSYIGSRGPAVPVCRRSRVRTVMRGSFVEFVRRRRTRVSGRRFACRHPGRRPVVFRCLYRDIGFFRCLPFR